MRTDPCRRFTFDITIESTQRRLFPRSPCHGDRAVQLLHFEGWKNCCLVLFDSHPSQDLDIVIHLFISLGFDPTVFRIRVKYDTSIKLVGSFLSLRKHWPIMLQISYVVVVLAFSRITANPTQARSLC